MYAICNLRLVIQRLELNEAINEMLETIPNTDLTFPSLNAPDVVIFFQPPVQQVMYIFQHFMCRHAEWGLESEWACDSDRSDRYPRYSLQ